MKLETIIAHVLAIDETQLNEASNAQNTPNWDSARHIELMLAIESAFQVQFTMPESTGLQNLGDMRRVLQSKGVAA